MKQLSEHFHEFEFACPCCDKLGVSDTLVYQILEPIRAYFGKPVFVSQGGGVRCRSYNRRIRNCKYCKLNYHGWTCPTCGKLGKQRSAQNSWHLRGTQADISVHTIMPEQVQTFARSLQAVTRLGCYRTFTHVGHGGTSFREWKG